jgi:Zn-dependent metalloprotease
MFKCNCPFVPDFIVKELGDSHTLSLSKKLRDRRNRIVRIVSELLKGKNLLVSSSNRNRLTYDCKNGTKLPGELILKEGSFLVSDEVINTAHENAAIVYNFYSSLLGRDSLDDKGMALKSSVHYDKDYNNAFWNGEQMVYGDGDGKIFISLCKDLSVCAHEFTHAVVQNTCGLYYVYQAGAANESYADKFGIACKQWHNKQNNPEEANWLLGDDIAAPGSPLPAIRTFKNEKAYKNDPQPKHMKNFKYMFEDNGGVHINSGILNHAFYLYCLKMGEPSFNRPIQIAYSALYKLKSTSGFKSVAKAEYLAAQELYGSGSKEAAAVKEAYKEVGIKI